MAFTGRCVLLFLAIASMPAAAGQAKTVHVFVALCDKVAGDANLVAYIGHNGLIDFDLSEIPPENLEHSPRYAVTLCCMSAHYFLNRLNASGIRPLLLTTQLMYPGAFLLEAAIDGRVKDESAAQIRERASQVYAENQHISVKAAKGVFSDLKPSPAPPNGYTRLKIWGSGAPLQGCKNVQGKQEEISWKKGL